MFGALSALNFRNFVKDISRCLDHDGDVLCNLDRFKAIYILYKKGLEI